MMGVGGGGMQNTWEGREWRKRRKKRKSRESTRCTKESLSGLYSRLDRCPRSLGVVRWSQHILGSQQACGWETGCKVTTPG